MAVTKPAKARNSGRNVVVCCNPVGEGDEPGVPPNNICRVHAAVEAVNDVVLPLRMKSQAKSRSVRAALAGSDDAQASSQLELLKSTLRRHDRVYIFGSGRAARTAIALANSVSGSASKATVRFLGLWELVVTGSGTSEINVNDLFPAAARRVEHCLALDESRPTFAPTLLDEQSRIRQVWFPGNHGDVCGGYWTSAMADLSLDYMLRRAMRDGLQANPAVLESLRPSATGMIRCSRSRTSSSKRAPRAVPDGARVHESVLQRMAAETPTWSEPDQCKRPYAPVNLPSRHIVVRSAAA